MMSTKLTWHGHAVLWLETDGYKIIVDPFLNDNPLATVKPDQVHPDFILLSHDHHDHVGDAVAIAKRSGAKVIANAEISRGMSQTAVTPRAQRPRRGVK